MNNDESNKVPDELDPFHDGWVHGLTLAAGIAEADKATDLANRIRGVAENSPGQTLCIAERAECIEVFEKIAKLVEHDSEIFNLMAPTWSMLVYYQNRELRSNRVENDTLEDAMQAQLDAIKAGDKRAELYAIERVLSFVPKLCNEVAELRAEVARLKGDTK